MHTILLTLYYLAIAPLCLYGLHRVFILYLYVKNRRVKPLVVAEFMDLPHVTVQLPVFNERYVVDRLLKSVKELDYPKDRLQIQVLDDSTDDTADYSREQIALLKAEGYQAEWVHRVNRVGFKAGALANGLTTATGEFIMILDADFIVSRDFLKKTIHHFTDLKVGMVQTRWGHTNRNYSLLTRAQALFLDAHFVLEQAGRSRSGRFFNFNGTGGIWRRACIEEAGGWEHDTLTEDLDLSYRAQMHGWRFVYDNDIITPAELPVEMNGFKSQQHRWAKGSMQTCLKVMPELWRSPLPLYIKLEGTAHLISYLVCLPVLLCLALQPVLPLTAQHSLFRIGLVDAPIFLLTTIPFVCYFFFAQREVNPRGWMKETVLIPFVVALGVAISINNARAVLEAILGVQSGFVRTPKYGIEKQGQTWRRGHYHMPIKSILIGAEIGCAFYFGWLTSHAIAMRMYECVPFLALFTLGFLYVAAASVQPLLPRFGTGKVGMGLSD